MTNIFGEPMEPKFSNGSIIVDRQLSDLDKLVIEFTDLLSKFGIKYVIISGYVAIALGRSRTTEDVDLFIDRAGAVKILGLIDALLGMGYWILNCDRKEAVEMLNENLAIRVAKKGRIIPNFEVKFPKRKIDKFSFDNSITLVLNGKRLSISQLEVQIPYKLWLGSDKDIEDAVHIYELCAKNLDKAAMAKAAKELNIEHEMLKYGIK